MLLISSSSSSTSCLVQGKQYFDSGDYMQANRKDKMQIASNPKAIMNPMNPQLTRLRGKPPASKLAGPSKLGAAHHATKVEQ